MVETVDRMLSVGVSWAWGGPADNLDRVDIVLLSTADMLLCEHVYGGSQDQACKSLAYNRDIRHDVLSDVHTDTRPLQNSIRILRTTNTLAYASDCTREGIHKHRLFCISHVANVCRRSQGVPAREDEWAAVSAVGSSEVTVSYVVAGSVRDQEGNPQQSRRACISDHLCQA